MNSDNIHGICIHMQPGLGKHFFFLELSDKYSTAYEALVIL